MTPMTSTRYLIVGGSAAGMAAAQVIRGLDRDGRVSILSEEKDAPYFRPMIPFIISRKKQAEQILLAGQGPYQSAGIDVHLQTRAVKIDGSAQRLITDNGATLPYDRLLIATGSRAYIPPEIQGTDLDGVFALRTLDDARRVAERAGSTSHAVMLGGGLLNLKAAFALLERKISVTLVVYSPEILSQLMEPEDACLIRSALEAAGLKIITGTSAERIIGNTDGVSGVVLQDGRELACQMVGIGKGVRPNCAWLESSEIRLAGGIVADQHTRTNVENIFTAGDVAVTYDSITGKPMTTGLWTNAVEMGRCAGSNMAGRPTAYGGTFGILNATQVAKMPFVSMGIVHTRGTEYEVCIRKTATAYRKLVFTPDGSLLVGAVFVGDITNAGLYRSVIKGKIDVRHIRCPLLGHRLHYGHLLGPKSMC